MLLRSRYRFMWVGRMQPDYLSSVGANARHRADMQAPMHRRSAIFVISVTAGSPAGGALGVRSDRDRRAFGNCTR